MLHPVLCHILIHQLSCLHNQPYICNWMDSLWHGNNVVEGILSDRYLMPDILDHCNWMFKKGLLVYEAAFSLILSNLDCALLQLLPVTFSPKFVQSINLRCPFFCTDRSGISCLGVKGGTSCQSNCACVTVQSLIYSPLKLTTVV